MNNLEHQARAAFSELALSGYFTKLFNNPPAQLDWNAANGPILWGDINGCSLVHQWIGFWAAWKLAHGYPEPTEQKVPDDIATDAARYRWIEQYAMRHWNGSIGQPETWRLTGWPFNLIRGPEFGPGVDAAMLATAKQVKP